jgi:hypothetical protein
MKWLLSTDWMNPHTPSTAKGEFKVERVSELPR